MHVFVTSKNVKWCHLIWPTLYNACHKTSCAVTALATVTVVDSDSDIAMWV